MTMSVDDFSCVCGYVVESKIMTSQNKGGRERGEGGSGQFCNRFSRPEKQVSFLYIHDN